MIAEMSAIDRFWPRLQWSLGSTSALLRAWVRLSLERRPKEGWRIDVALIAGYQFVFSGLLIGLLTWQLPQLTESWKYAIPALIICYGIATLPGALGFALVLRDEAARMGTIFFSVGHALLDLEYIRRGIAPHPALTATRIAVDLLIILVLCRQPVRRQFQLTHLALHLGNEPPGFI